MIFEIFISPQFAVIPIVVNAGAAFLPAILAAVTTFVALLFKPRELLRLCRAKPQVPVIVLLIAGGLYALIAFWPAAAPAAAGGRRALAAQSGPVGAQAVYVDWTRVALARIEARQNGSAPAAPAATSIPEVATTEPFIFRNGPERLGSIGEAPGLGLKLAWKHYPAWTDENGAAQEDTEAMILSSAAVHGSRVFGASCLLDPPDSFGVLFCVDAASRTDNPPSSSQSTTPSSATSPHLRARRLSKRARSFPKPGKA